jgi:hypothetical protein
MKVYTNPDHHAVTIVLSAGVGVNDPGHHHQSTTIAQGTKTRRSKSPKKAYDYEDDEKEMGAPCFTRRVHSIVVPKGFKLPHDQQKYDGSQEPHSWLSDYLQAVRIIGGSKEITMQSLQLHLTGATRSWLGMLDRETIGSWDELTRKFTSNFKSTYK